jgi:hypothetical protein
VSETAKVTNYAVFPGGVGLGVWWFVWGAKGFWWGVLYGLFWPVWAGYRLADYLL